MSDLAVSGLPQAGAGRLSLPDSEPVRHAPAGHEPAPASWLISDSMDRERMLDMDRRVAPVRRKSFAVMAVALLLCGPWLGWWTLAPLAVAAILFKLADDAVERVTHPEYLLFAAWTGSQAIIATAVPLTGGAHSPAMAWFAIPIVTLSARFPARGVAAGWAVSLLTRPARRRISAVVRPSPLGRQPGGANRYIQTSCSERADARSLASPIHGEKFTTNGLRDEWTGVTVP